MAAHNFFFFFFKQTFVTSTLHVSPNCQYYDNCHFPICGCCLKATRWGYRIICSPWCLLLCFLHPDGSLSEAHEGAAREGQTHLRQHVPKVCREGFQGNGSCHPQTGRLLLNVKQSWNSSTNLAAFWFFCRKRPRRWRARRTGTAKIWRSTVLTRKQRATRKSNTP